MQSVLNSRYHHWWPVALQSYWEDRSGNVSWIDPDGKVNKKLSRNRKIGLKIHGHNFFRGSSWGRNFEGEFDIDNEIHDIVSSLKRLRPLGSSFADVFRLAKILFKQDRTLRGICKFYHLEEQLHRNLLLLALSLLIRSPANRNRYESAPSLFGAPRDEEVGKANMLQNYLTAKDLSKNGSLSNHYFVILHSPLKKFICGDGYLDWLTSDLVAFRISGRAIIPLTPNICIYVATPNPMAFTPNCASLIAAPWMVEWINEITQVYSRNSLFYVGKPPKIIDAFRQHQFLQHKNWEDELIELLDGLAGFDKSATLDRNNRFS